MGVSSIDWYGTRKLTVRASVILAASYSTQPELHDCPKALRALTLRFSMAQGGFVIAVLVAAGGWAAPAASRMTSPRRPPRTVTCEILPPAASTRAANERMTT
jgi:hypothetical protein